MTTAASSRLRSKANVGFLQLLASRASALARKGPRRAISTLEYRAKVLFWKSLPPGVSRTLGSGLRSCVLPKGAHNGQADGTGRPAQAKSVAALVPAELRATTMQIADQYLRNTFTFRGERRTFPEEIDWSLEPADNRGWRWDLNRHGFLPTLGLAYRYSGDPAYLAKIKAILSSWSSANPQSLRGANWNEPFEVAARLSNWLSLHEVLAHSDGSAGPIVDTLLTGIHDHAVHLFRFIETHVPNNHLLLEARALYQAALALPRCAHVDRWRSYAARHIRQQLRRQIQGDGGHSEQSVTYQRILASELWATYLSSTVQTTAPDALDLYRVLMSMSAFLKSMMRPDGSFPLTGDSTVVDTYYRFNPFMIAAAVSGNAAFKTAALSLGETDLTYFAMGSDLSTRYLEVKAETNCSVSEALPESGYYIFRDPSLGLHGVVDCGPFGDELLSAHGHDDILSLDVSLNGTPMIIDAGAAGWPHDTLQAAEWRSYFRGAASHNVLIVDGQNRSQFRSAGEVSRTAKPLSCAWHSDSRIDYFAGSHDGYIRSLGVVHERIVIVIRGQFVCVLDRVIGQGTHEVELLYHVSPEKRACIKTTTAVELQHAAKAAARIDFFGAATQVCVRRGMRITLQGWVSLEAAVPREADAISARGVLRLPVVLGTLLQPAGMNLYGVQPLVGNEQSDDRGHCAVVLTRGEDSVEISVRDDGWAAGRPCSGRASICVLSQRSGREAQVLLRRP